MDNPRRTPEKYITDNGFLEKDPNQASAGWFSKESNHQKNQGWHPTLFYKGSSGDFSSLTIHASILESGTLPHDPHFHDDEEIFVVLSGSIEVILVDQDDQEKQGNLKIKKFGFVYHSKNHIHTLRSSGPTEAQYLVIRWKRDRQPEDHVHPFCVIFSKPKKFPQNSRGFQIQPADVLQQKSNHRLRAHYSQMSPGSGYPAHQDPYDLILIFLKGSAEINDTKVSAPGIVICEAGLSHSLKNPGNTPAEYLVFEFIV